MPQPLIDQAIASQKSFTPHYRIWRWPTLGFAIWFVLVLVVPASWFRMLGGFGELVRIFGILGPFVVPIFAVAALGAWLNNRSRASKFEAALENPARIARIVPVIIVMRGMRFRHISLVLDDGKEAMMFVPGFTEDDVRTMVAEVAARAPHAAIGAARAPAAA